MLVLTRRIGEKIVIDGVISITVVSIKGDNARLGVDAPSSICVDRWEVHQRRQASRPERSSFMRTVQQGDRVQVHYVKRLQDGATFSSREPLALTVGIDHPRLPGLGTALLGMAMGQATTWTVPPELAYGFSDATRIRRWSRKRFPKEAMLCVGKFQRFMDKRGRRRQVRILEVKSNVVVVDTNQRGVGQTVEMKVILVGFLGPLPGREEIPASQGMKQPGQCRAVAFDVDAASLASLRAALPEWEIVLVNGATPASLSGHWDPSSADLLVVGTQANAADTLGLCRLLSFCTSYSPEARSEPLESLAWEQSPPTSKAVRNAPLLVLVPRGQETLVGAALEAGAWSCLLLPIHAKQVTSMLAQARAGSRPGRHTLGRERAQQDDPWQEDGGEA
jgi:carbon storage regulator CsrA